MTLIGRPHPIRVNPPGSISNTGQTRPIVQPPGVLYVPQPTANVGAPGRGPGFALSDHVHAGGGSGGFPPPPAPGTKFSIYMNGSGYNSGNFTGSQLPLAAPWTFVTWFLTIQDINADIPQLSRWGDFSGLYIELTFHKNGSDGSIDIQNSGGGGDTYLRLGTYPVPFDGKPHMLAITYDGATLQAYLDGTLTDTQSRAGMAQGSGGVTFGEQGIHYKGYLDETAFFNYVLNGSQIANLAHAGINTYAVLGSLSPIRRWDYDERLGGVANDAEGGSVPLTIGGAQGQPPLI
jgi:hypothetical protein